MVDCCSKCAANNFDPTKMDETGRDRGGAWHLMSVDDDARTRMRKGQAHSAGVKVRETRDLITRAVLAEMAQAASPACGPSPPWSTAARTPSANIFDCYVTAITSAAV